METCTICGGTVAKKLIKYTQEIDGELIVVENVPAEVCEQCGEELFTPEITSKLQRILGNYREEPTTKKEALFINMATSKV